ncbi:MAG: AMP-binding protein, partial [Candidatus Marinimicrobia bacterium]|nr:AMP-binding protein [Candidatus Neomarinimicrobiota bacterium]
MEISTIAELFLRSVDNLPDHPAYFDKVNGEWVKTTYAEAGQIVENLAFGLASLGVKSSDKVAILSGNQSKWALSDYAITGLGAATVTVYPTLISSQIKYIVENSDTKLIFVEDEEQTAKVLEFIDDLTELKTVVVMNDQTSDDKRLIGFSDLIKTGSDFKSTAGFT